VDRRNKSGDDDNGVIEATRRLAGAVPKPEPDSRDAQPAILNRRIPYSVGPGILVERVGRLIISK
jgi:hypothetical protein